MLFLHYYEEQLRVSQTDCFIIIALYDLISKDQKLNFEIYSTY